MKLSTEHLKFINLGERYWTASLQKVNEAQREALKSYINELPSYLQRGMGLYLWGDNNVGKSYVAAALCKHVWGAYRMSSYLVLASDLKEAWIEKQEASPDAEESIADRVARIRFLVIDDLGKEHRAASGFAEVKFGALLRSRSRSVKTTVITSNMSPKEFGEVYGRSTSQLAKECLLPIQLKGPDMRKGE